MNKITRADLYRDEEIKEDLEQEETQALFELIEKQLERDAEGDRDYKNIYTVLKRKAQLIKEKNIPYSLTTKELGIMFAMPVYTIERRIAVFCTMGFIKVSKTKSNRVKYKIMPFEEWNAELCHLLEQLYAFKLKTKEGVKTGRTKKDMQVLIEQEKKMKNKRDDFINKHHKENW